MAKRMLALLLAMGIMLSLPAAAFASSQRDRDPVRTYSTYTRRGIYSWGVFSRTQVQFGFIPDEEAVVLVTNNEVETEPYFGEIWAGSDLYVPVGVIDDDAEDVVLASDKFIKDYNVAVSYKATSGDQYVLDVDLVNGKKEKVDGLESGTYAKITFGEYEGTGTVPVEVALVLSVNKRSCQETRIFVSCVLRNYMQTIDRNSVYSAIGPSQFIARSGYNGEATFDFGDKIKYTALVSSQTRYYLNLSREIDKDIDDMYSSSYLEFYNFKGAEDTFASQGRLELPVDLSKFQERNSQPEIYVYEVVDNQLRSMGQNEVTYERSKEMVIITTNTLGNYVLSNEALLKDVDERNWDVIRTGYAEPEATDEDVIPEEPAPVDYTQPESNPTGNPGTGMWWEQDESSALEESNRTTDVAAYRASEEEEREPELVISPIVNAANSSGSNPPTGDSSRPIIALILGGGALITAIVLRVTRHRI